MTATATAPAARRNLLTVEEFAECLALRPKTIRQWVFRREVPFVRVGHSIRFRPETIDEIIQRGNVAVGRGRRRGAPAKPTEY
jgi:excisionase family DNA binding protein